jgi:uncharacterized membrane protein YjgN (DUF898 family)
MKNYFSFNLTGKKFLPLWLLFVVLFIIPYLALISVTKQVQPGDKPSLIFFPLLFILIIVAFVFSFYIVKMTIENISWQGKSIVFNGSFGEYFGKVLLGFFLSIITLGIYMAWFIRDVHRFFINHSSYDGQDFDFQGTGGKLFVILLLTLMVPVFVLSFVMVGFMVGFTSHATVISIVFQLVILIIMVPYLYFVYRWMVNVNYKDYHITWETDALSSCGKILGEMILAIITVGIYSPLATVRLYKYFADRTVAAAPDRRHRFGYDADQLNDFLFIWGQTLLTIITLGIYYPWAFCRIFNRILGKTYLEKNN